MKNLKTLLFAIAMLFFYPNVNAQKLLDGVGKKIEKKLKKKKQEVTKKINKKINEAVDKIVDGKDSSDSSDESTSDQNAETIVTSPSVENTSTYENNSGTENPNTTYENGSTNNGNSTGNQTSNNEYQSTPKKSTKTIIVYRDVVLGDQANEKYGAFFQPSTGQSVDLEAAGADPKSIHLVLFKEYGSTQVLTFPGNARDASAYKDEYANNPLFSDEDGVESWDDANSGEILESSMTQSKFNTIAEAASVKSFSAAFAAANGGSAKLSTIHYVWPKANNVYLIQMNDGLRAIMLVKNAVPTGSKGGSIKFDIILEVKDGGYNNQYPSSADYGTSGGY